MFVLELIKIGNKLLKIRKSRGMTQAEVAEKAELSDRTYADIERGNVNMRLDTLIKICKALGITPNDILIEEQEKIYSEKEICDLVMLCSEKERRTVLKLMSVYLESVKNNIS